MCQIRVGEGLSAWGSGELSEIPYRGWNRKEGRGNKDDKKGAKTGSKGVYLKNGAWKSFAYWKLLQKKKDWHYWPWKPAHQENEHKYDFFW